MVNVKFKTISALVMISLISNSFAKDLGSFGETYTIAEQDFLEFIQSKAANFEQSGKSQAVKETMKQAAIRYRDRPPSVSGVTTAVENKTFDFDPSITLDHNIYGNGGQLIAVAGTRINPLVYVPLTKTLIFINSDDNKQIKWAAALDEKLKGKDKIILVDGSVLQAENSLNKKVYFDQNGRITTRFNIEHVPTTVVQNGIFLKISEVKL